MITSRAQRPFAPLLAGDHVSRWPRLLNAHLTVDRCILFVIVCSTVLAQVGELSVAGFAFRGWAWVVILVGGLFFLLPHRLRGPVRGAWWLWIPWVLWMVEKTDFSSRDAAQRFFIFLTPLLTLCACSSLRGLSVEAVKKAMHLLAVLSVLVYAAAVLSARSLSALVGWYSVAGIAMTFTLLAVSVCADQYRRRSVAAAWIAVYYLILVFSESRMPVVVIPALVVFGYNGMRPSVKCLAGLAILAAAVAAFHTPPVQESLFHRGFGSLGELFSFDPDVVNLSGRLNAWPQFLGGIENRWLGDGATSSAVFGYATFRGWTHPHNAYIRILFDYGYVGFVLLSVPAASLLVSLVRRGRRYRDDPSIRWLFRASVNGLLAMLLLGISGNVLMYIAYIGNMLFALIGCTYAIERKTPCESD